MDRSHRLAIARSARDLRQLELDLARFRRSAVKGVLETVFQAMAGDPDFEYVIVDGTIVRVHQHGTGAKGGLKIRPLAAPAAG